MNVFQFPEQKLIEKFRNVISHQPGEIEWPNVVVTASKKKYQKSVFESSFTIFANIKGTVNLQTNKRNLKICEQTFYLCNPFESFRYEIDSEEETDTFNIHLNYNFYTKAKNAFLSSNEELLDNPSKQETSFSFNNQLHYRDLNFNRLIQSYQEKEEETFMIELFQHCLMLDVGEKGRRLNIPVAKKSTKEELAGRMAVAKDYLFSNYNDAQLSVASLSALVSMSRFHFLRIFKNVYGVSPYQYLKGMRIEKAKYLIQKTDMSIDEVAYAVGFQESTALYPVLKKELKQTPREYRKENRNFQ
ncbi:helix-turn-helix domain-containing protein [Maribellus comscasis]|uniref:Helix-turn-helix domain-containing protein n=1 Tax=Maribellus comscasis TaxID=2681766 RepID=A0A6I6K0M6_9BACT|nr:AraC family transcriptional regulator [Maribellus comscasis]QGY46978.1 helix-turn-helix domain-containing protein [Maribellus comscasis]